MFSLISAIVKHLQCTFAFHRAFSTVFKKELSRLKRYVVGSDSPHHASRSLNRIEYKKSVFAGSYKLISTRLGHHKEYLQCSLLQPSSPLRYFCLHHVSQLLCLIPIQDLWFSWVMDRFREMQLPILRNSWEYRLLPHRMHPTLFFCVPTTHSYVLFLKSVGNLRFAPPEPPLTFSGVRQTTKFGNACPQQAMNTSIPGLNSRRSSAPPVSSEDCEIVICTCCLILF